MSKENNKHIILCPHTEATNVFRASVKLFHQQLVDIETHPGIIEIFITYLGNRNTFSMLQCIGPHNHCYNKEVYNTIRYLAKHTDLTSWHLFTSGILLRGWEHLQQKHYTSMTYCMRKGPTWSKIITRSLLHIIHTLWLHRNKHLHDNDNPDYVTKEAEKLQKEINQVYTQGTTGIAPTNQNIFDISREEILQMPISRKRQWLASVSTAKKRTKVINLSQPVPIFYSAHERHNYTIRHRALRKSSSRNFKKWWLRHHPYSSRSNPQPLRPCRTDTPTTYHSPSQTHQPTQLIPQSSLSPPTSQSIFTSLPSHLFLPYSAH